MSEDLGRFFGGCEMIWVLEGDWDEDGVCREREVDRKNEKFEFRDGVGGSKSRAFGLDFRCW